MHDLTQDEIDAIEYVRALFPNRWRRVLREAWMSGDYSKITSSERNESVLQGLRNARGPSWLENYRGAS